MNPKTNQPELKNANYWFGTNIMTNQEEEKKSVPNQEEESKENKENKEKIRGKQNQPDD